MIFNLNTSVESYHFLATKYKQPRHRRILGCAVLLPGVLSQWNAEHPTESIDVGDRIVKLAREQLQGLKLIQKIKEVGLDSIDAAPGCVGGGSLKKNRKMMKTTRTICVCLVDEFFRILPW